ncbi:MAG: hypothetical protein HGA61_00540 [Candidatus Moranbacteria bacterium]|nr:hypothetical protein [Candidatus Moranbacteria bacterium]
MAITKEEFISELNKDLEWEYAAAVQYVQHAAMLTGPEYDSIGKELVIHSNEEMGHAVTVSTIICDLGGVPTVDVEKRVISEDSKAMLLGVLNNQPGAAKDIVVLNAGAALYAADVADSMQAGIQLAKAAIESGAAKAKLDALVALSARLAK